MQKQGKDIQQYGICHRLFNFIMNTLIGRGNGGERVDSKPMDDDSDPAVKIHFKQTEELDKLGSFANPSGKKEIPLQNGTQGTKKIIIPITNRAGQNEKKKNKAGNEFPTAEPVLTGLGLNINEVSENYIAKTKRKMSENLSFMQHEES
ncbi:hypothetical protein HRI_002248100 [Hibiscus trionum]|uniref:Uncharacterized protein n=1 Tax=Hibiscus trionum TaxID=183268 RepID=A0A9W7M2X2_HIBTR|nr:hypothetical protein HRI_002248100 [Hibiscus trionum]